MSNQEERNERHKKAMQRKKAHVDKRIAEATTEKNLLLVLTGNGKGKSSSAFGMLARSVGHGMKCAVVQFIKGQWNCGEHANFAEHPLVDFHRSTDITAAEQTWVKAEEFLTDCSYELVILDELTYMLTYGYLEKSRILKAIKNRPKNQHAVVTGRNASKELISLADTVSEINNTKHAFDSGIKVQKGIDY